MHENIHLFDRCSWSKNTYIVLFTLSDLLVFKINLQTN